MPKGEEHNKGPAQPRGGGGGEREMRTPVPGSAGLFSIPACPQVNMADIV